MACYVPLWTICVKLSGGNYLGAIAVSVILPHLLGRDASTHAQAKEMFELSQKCGFISPGSLPLEQDSVRQ